MRGASGAAGEEADTEKIRDPFHGFIYGFDIGVVA
jgi:hypothetical protein